jgi:2-phosphosulfolactate phosphatase
MGILTSDVPPPPPDAEAGARPTGVALVPALATPELLRGSVVVVIDALRASTTIGQALESGAECVRATMTVKEAVALRGQLAATRGEAGPAAVVRLGGERGGVRPEGFDAGNSPQDYQPGGRAGIEPGCTLVFTSTNGTGTLLHAAGHALPGGRVLVGSLRNRRVVCELVAQDARAVLIVCAGTREAVSMEDSLVAGAIVEGLLERGRSLLPDDSSRVCAALWQRACATSGGVLEAFSRSRGGRNLTRLGLGADIAFCAVPDVSAVVPELKRDEAGWRLDRA